MKNKYILYYVEGLDEKKILDVLKSEMMIKPGKIQVLNIIQNKISDTRLMTLKPDTIIVLVFDTDTNNNEILQQNISKLKKCSCVSNVYTIPQVTNLEDELIRSCDIKCIKELLNSKSSRDFKRDLIKTTNLSKKLKEKNFDLEKFWATKPTSHFADVNNNASKIKIHKK